MIIQQYYFIQINDINLNSIVLIRFYINNKLIILYIYKLFTKYLNKYSNDYISN